mmetsp:Transcript_7448/g.19549  ORF Transcript_7448/g.19549 Transcript_7448/m.19549 type:complete len:521 (-) Transcript_7448:645-2207(-)
MGSTDQQLAALTAQVGALAAELEHVKENVLSQESADTFWLIFSGILVFFMQCGFGMLEAGAVASKSTEGIMLKNLFDAALAGVLWWLIGYGLTNEGGNPFMGITPAGNRSSHFASYEMMENSVTPGKDWAILFFQYTFAAASATIVSGAVAERAQLPAYCIFSSLITGFVYPVVAHWVWSDSGWLSCSNPASGFFCMVDFAGSGVVHATGGVSALAGAAIIGPRMGRFDPVTGMAIPMPGHSSVLQVLGTFILWLGWYGFNAGSTVGITTDLAQVAGRVVVTTTLAAAGGGIMSVCLEKLLGATRSWDVSAMCNGILAGLVSVTAGCATVEPWATLLVGILGACAYRAASKLMLHMRIDDPLDAVAVHGACGYWGLLSCALLSTPELSTAITSGRNTDGGLFYGGSDMLGAVCLFLLAHIAWVGTLSSLMFFGLRKLAILRVPPHLEMAGKDFNNSFDHSAHGGQHFGTFLPHMTQPAGANADVSTHTDISVVSTDTAAALPPAATLASTEGVVGPKQTA